MKKIRVWIPVCLLVLVWVLGSACIPGISISPRESGEPGLTIRLQTEEETASLPDSDQPVAEQEIEEPVPATDAPAEPAPPADHGPRPDVVVPADGWVDFAAFVKLIHTGRWQFSGGEVRLQYSYQGREQIQGIETDKAMGNSREDNPDCWVDWIMWVDDQGQIVKLIANDEVIDEQWYGFYKLLIASPLASFALEEVDPEFNQEFKQVLAGQQVSGWDLHRFDQKKEQIGGKTADVHTVILEHWAFGQGEARFEYGDFGWFKIMLNRLDYTTNWETLELTFRQ